MSDPATDSRAQLVEKLQSASNVLVTVSADPSVDQLSACIALTLLLNKYKKNTTAVFSGKVPGVLDFLKPADTLKKTTDSLRDFIIALDKSKADKLRYKVEDDVVKIFITPYRTSITAKDLQYSAGDFNVDVIVALGVRHQQDLDTAITAHGRIFHDAVTVCINNTSGGDLGIVNWQDLESSSLSELVAQLADSLDPSLMDADIATALLTGIVAETSRFSNGKTHPRTMNISSRLLQAGADQQLVNTNLQDLIGKVVGVEIKPETPDDPALVHHNDVGNELVVGEDGKLREFKPETPSGTVALQPKNTVSSAEPAGNPKPANSTESASGHQNDQKEPVNGMSPQANIVPVPDLQLPDLPPVPAARAPVSMPEPIAPGSLAAPAPTSIESLLGEPVVSTPAPLLDNDVPASNTAGAQRRSGDTQKTPQADDDADSARQAVEAALAPESNGANGNATPAIGTLSAGMEFFDPPEQPGPAKNPALSPITSPVDSPVANPAPVQPLIQPITTNQPSYANPATMTPYEMPAVTQNEPAPLSMSPADMTTTMPQPSVDAITASPMPPQPAAPGSSQYPGVTPPPPLPPPMPPNFG